MKVELLRRWFTKTTTIGELLIDGKFVCYTLEDRFRAPPEKKVPHETCIPMGKYRLLWTHSPRFGRMMLLVDSVLNFSGIRIHGGNKAADTDGCILPGTSVSSDRLTVSQSKVALDKIEALIVPVINSGEDVWMTVAEHPRAERL